MTGQTNVSFSSDDINVIIESSLPETVDIDTICVIYPTPSLVRETKIMQGRDLGGSWRIATNSATGYTTKYPVGVAIKDSSNIWASAVSYLGTSSGWVRLGTPLIMNQIYYPLIDMTGAAHTDGWAAARSNNLLSIDFTLDETYTSLTVITNKLQTEPTGETGGIYQVMGIESSSPIALEEYYGYGSAGKRTFDITSSYAVALPFKRLFASCNSSSTNVGFVISGMWAK